MDANADSKHTTRDCISTSTTIQSKGVARIGSLAILFGLSFFLFFFTIKDFFYKYSALPQKLAHFGFSLFIISVLFNGILAKEYSSNMKVGDKREFMLSLIHI